MTRASASGDLSLIRAVTHEDFEVLMQREEGEHPVRYERLKGRILKDEKIMAAYRVLSPYKDLDIISENTIFNNLIATAFELITLIDEKLALKEELTEKERAFADMMRPIVAAKDSAGRYRNFSALFFNQTERLKTVRKLQRNPDVRFRRASVPTRASASGIKGVNGSEGLLLMPVLAEEVQKAKVDASYEKKIVFELASMALRDAYMLDVGALLSRVHKYDNYQDIMKVIAKAMIMASSIDPQSPSIQLLMPSKNIIAWNDTHRNHIRLTGFLRDEANAKSYLSILESETGDTRVNIRETWYVDSQIALLDALAAIRYHNPQVLKSVKARLRALLSNPKLSHIIVERIKEVVENLKLYEAQASLPEREYPYATEEFKTFHEKTKDEELGLLADSLIKDREIGDSVGAIQEYERSVGYREDPVDALGSDDRYNEEALRRNLLLVRIDYAAFDIGTPISFKGTDSQTSRASASGGLSDSSDYYETLGISRDADLDAVKHAFWELAKIWHPDVHPEEAAKREAERKFKAIAEAYSVLSDPDKRRAYDDARAGGAAFDNSSVRDVVDKMTEADFDALFFELWDGTGALPDSYITALRASPERAFKVMSVLIRATEHAFDISLVIGMASISVRFSDIAFAQRLAEVRERLAPLVESEDRITKRIKSLLEKGPMSLDEKTRVLKELILLRLEAYKIILGDEALLVKAVNEAEPGTWSDSNIPALIRREVGKIISDQQILGRIVEMLRLRSGQASDIRALPPAGEERASAPRSPDGGQDLPPAPAERAGASGRSPQANTGLRGTKPSRETRGSASGEEDWIYVREPDGKLTKETIGYPGRWVVIDRSERHSPEALLRIGKSVSIAAQRVSPGTIEEGEIEIDEVNSPEGIRLDLVSAAAGKLRLHLQVDGSFLYKDRFTQRDVIEHAIREAAGKPLSEKAFPEAGDKTEKVLKRNPKVLFFVHPLRTDSPRAKRYQSIPNNILSLASSLKRSGADVEFAKIDLMPLINPESYDEKKVDETWMEFMTLLMDRDLDMVGLSLFEGDFPYIAEVIKLIRPKTRALIAVGGPMPTLMPEQTAVVLPFVNLLLRGECEEAFPNAVHALAGMRWGDAVTTETLRKLSGVEGLYFQNSGTLLTNGLDKRNRIDDLDGISLDFSLLKEDDLSIALDLNTSRGCPKTCVFCSKVHGKKTRFMCAQRVLAILKNYQDRLEEVERKTGRELPEVAWAVDMNDDDFLADTDRAIAILEGMKGMRLKLTPIQSSITSLLIRDKGKTVPNERMIRALSSSGVFMERPGVWLGTDAFTDTELKNLSKGYTVAGIEKVIACLERHHVRHAHYLILSNRHTRWADFSETLSNLKGLFGPYLHDSYFIGLLVNTAMRSYQTTPSYKMLQEKGEDGLVQKGVLYDDPNFPEFACSYVLYDKNPSIDIGILRRVAGLLNRPGGPHFLESIEEALMFLPDNLNIPGEGAECGRASASGLAATPWYAPTIEELIMLAGIERGDNIVDIGTGEEMGARAIAEKVGPRGNVTAIYISREKLISARTASAGYPNVRVIEADPMGDLRGITGEGVDKVFAFNFIHLIEDKDRFLENVSGILKAGGTLALCTSYFAGSQSEKANKAFSKFYTRVLRILRERYPDEKLERKMDAWRRQLSEEDYPGLLEEAGFIVVKKRVTHHMTGESLRRFFLDKDVLAGLLPGVGTEVASKVVEEAWDELLKEYQGEDTFARDWLYVVAKKEAPEIHLRLPTLAPAHYIPEDLIAQHKDGFDFIVNVFETTAAAYNLAINSVILDEKVSGSATIDEGRNVRLNPNFVTFISHLKHVAASKAQIFIEDDESKLTSDLATSIVYSTALREVHGHFIDWRDGRGKHHLLFSSEEMFAQDKRGIRYLDINFAAILFYWLAILGNKDCTRALQIVDSLGASPVFAYLRGKKLEKIRDMVGKIYDQWERHDYASARLTWNIPVALHRLAPPLVPRASAPRSPYGGQDLPSAPTERTGAFPRPIDQGQEPWDEASKQTRGFAGQNPQANTGLRGTEPPRQTRGSASGRRYPSYWGISNIMRGLYDEDETSSGEVSRTIGDIQQIAEREGRAAKVLVIGAGGGRITYDLIKTFPGIKFVFINKERLVLSEDEDEAARLFSDITKLQSEKRKGVAVSLEDAKAFLHDFNTRYITVHDVDTGLPYEDGSFDGALVTRHTFEYIDKKYELFVEAKRVLRRDGIGFFNGLGEFSIIQPLTKEFFASQPNGEYEYREIFSADSGSTGMAGLLKIINRNPQSSLPRLDCIWSCEGLRYDEGDPYVPIGKTYMPAAARASAPRQARDQGQSQSRASASGARGRDMDNAERVTGYGIPADAYNAYEEVRSDVEGLYNDAERNAALKKILKTGRGLARYSKQLQSAGRRAGTRGRAIYYPFGGFDSYIPFTLVEGATDVFSMGLDHFGRPEDIRSFIRNAQPSDRAGNEFSTFEKFLDLYYLSASNKVMGLGGFAVAKILSFLGGRIEGIYYFDVEADGGFRFLTKGEVGQAERLPRNAVIEFRDRKSGRVKRYWYLQTDTYHRDEPYLKFTERLAFGTLLLKAPMSRWDGNVNELSNRAMGIDETLEPARRNGALVITDVRLSPEGETLPESIPHPIWEPGYMPGSIDFNDGFGYGKRIYFGSSRHLITAQTPLWKIRGYMDKGEKQGFTGDYVQAEDPSADLRGRLVQDMISIGFGIDKTPEWEEAANAALRTIEPLCREVSKIHGLRAPPERIDKVRVANVGTQYGAFLFEFRHRTILAITPSYYKRIISDRSFLEDIVLHQTVRLQGLSHAQAGDLLNYYKAAKGTTGRQGDDSAPRASASGDKVRTGIATSEKKELLNLAWSTSSEVIMSREAINAQRFISENLGEWLGDKVTVTGVNIGSGRGTFSAELETRFPKCTIFDIDAASFAPDLLREGRFIQDDAETLETITSSSQDFAISTFALNYLDTTKASMAMLRVLKDGGRAFLIIHHPEGVYFLLSRLTPDTRPYSARIYDIQGVLRWLQQRRALVEGKIRPEECTVSLPGTIYRSIVRATRGKIEEWLLLPESAREKLRENLLLAIEADRSKLINILIMDLLWQTREGLLEDTDEIRDFFSKLGFNVLKAEVVPDRIGEIYAFGVVLEKPRASASGVAAVQKAFDGLDKMVRQSDANVPVSRLNGTAQRMTDATKLRLSVPVEVLKNSADITLTLRRLGALAPSGRGGRIPFELVVTGVTDEDIAAINGLNRDDIRQALNLSGELTVTMIREEDIQNVAISNQRLNYDASTALGRARIIKDMHVGTLRDGEYMAIATDAVGEDEAKGLEKELASELIDNISIRILVRPEAGKSMFSLSAIIDDWLKFIQKDEKSTIRIILPTLISPAEMIKRLEEAVRNAWQVLAAA